MNLYRSTFFALYLFDFFSFWDENYRLYPRLQSCMRVKYEISNVSQFLKFSYFFHFVNFELLIGDFTFSVVNPISCPKVYSSINH